MLIREASRVALKRTRSLDCLARREAVFKLWIKPFPKCKVLFARCRSVGLISAWHLKLALLRGSDSGAVVPVKMPQKPGKVPLRAGDATSASRLPSNKWPGGWWLCSLLHPSLCHQEVGAKIAKVTPRS